MTGAREQQGTSSWSLDSVTAHTVSLNSKHTSRACEGAFYAQYDSLSIRSKQAQAELSAFSCSRHV